jgi:hypothetical protein
MASSKPFYGLFLYHSQSWYQRPVRVLQVPEQVIAQQVLELAQMHPQLERVLAECQRGCYHTGSPFRPVATTRRNTVGRRLRRSSKRNERTARDNRPL